MHLTFLESATPLTKTYERLADGTINKTSYPHVYEVTSHTELVTSIADFERSIKAHAAKNNCLLKGTPTRTLVKESRAGTTDSNASSEWVCFDIDGLPQTTPESFLAAIGVTDVSYVVQYSASYLIDSKDLRCHIFMLLDKAMAAPLLKQWLMDLNLSTPLLNSAMSLTKTGNSISWVLDVSACQNDKLLYIAPPTLRNIKDPIGKAGRIQLVKKDRERLAITHAIPSTAKNRERINKRLDELRETEGLPKRKTSYRMHGGMEVMVRPDVCAATEIKHERGFVYFNLNGGDSWAYYHPEDRPDYIYNFKGEPVYLTKELLPEYWEQLTQSASRVSSTGLIYLAFCDRNTSAYWRGTYDQAQDVLDIHQARTETQLRHFGKQNGLPIGDYIPEWDMTFDPQIALTTPRVDFKSQRLNLFGRTEYMKATQKKQTKCPPLIRRIVHHALGGDDEIFDYFINWVAYILQNLDRTGTAWILSGTEGCLAGETKIAIKRGKRNGGKDRELSIKEAFEKHTSVSHRNWDRSITTFSKSVKDGMTVGYHEVYDIVEAGTKQLYKLTTTRGRTIRVTELHPFMRPDGSFTELKDLRVGDDVVVEGEHNAHVANPQGRKQRHTTYSIPHHPLAWQHIIAGKNYKRCHTARLVVEADMNGLTLDEFVHILRTDERRALSLCYLGEKIIIHHVDEDPSNDALSNLKAVDKLNHDQHHAKSVGLGTISTKIERIKSIKKDKVEMTYDMTMKAPYQNYIANGFAVHNTGKGLLMNSIIRPMFGMKQTTVRRLEELAEKYNGFLRGSLFVFIDEIQTSTLQNEAAVLAKMRNFITEPVVTVREMGAVGTEVRNFSNWICNANANDPVTIPKGDRRWNVGRYQTEKLQITPQEVANIAKELQAFHDFLAQYKVDAIAARTPLDTADRNQLISISETSVDAVSAHLLDGEFGFFVDQLPTSDTYKLNALELNKVEGYTQVLRALLQRTNMQTQTCNISRDELRTIYEYTVGSTPTTPHKFTSYLKHHRIHMKKVWIGQGTVNGIQVSWKDTAAWTQYQGRVTPTQAQPAQLPQKLRAVK